MIERAHREGEKLLGLSVWGTDQAGPFQTIPYPGSSWQPQGKPARQPHQHIRNGTAKLMTLFHPATGEVRVKGVRSSTNAVLHPWLEEHLRAILETLPLPQLLSPEEDRAMWRSWQEGLTVKVTLPEDLPPLRMLLVLDNLTGHKNPELLLWMFSRGIMVLYTPLGASWLNMRASRCSGSSSAGHWKDIIPRTPKRSSNGWKRGLEDGTVIRRLLSGAADERHGEIARARGDMLWEEAELAVGAPSEEDARP